MGRDGEGREPDEEKQVQALSSNFGKGWTAQIRLRQASSGAPS